MLPHDPLRLPDFGRTEPILLFLVSVGQNPAVTMPEAEHANLMFLELKELSLHMFKLLRVRGVTVLGHSSEKGNKPCQIPPVQFLLDELPGGG